MALNIFQPSVLLAHRNRPHPLKINRNFLLDDTALNVLLFNYSITLPPISDKIPMKLFKKNAPMPIRTERVDGCCNCSACPS